MGLPSKALKIGAELVLTLMLLSLAFIMGRQTAKTTAALTESVSDKYDEIENENIELLTSHQLEGSEVLNAIRKYSNICDIEIIFKQSQEDNADSKQNPFVISRGESYTNDVNNIKDGKYIAADALFQCKVERNSNDVLTKLVFSELGTIDDSAKDAAKAAICKMLYGTVIDNKSWDEIASDLEDLQIRDNVVNDLLQQNADLQNTITSLNNQIEELKGQIKDIEQPNNNSQEDQEE